MKEALDFRRHFSQNPVTTSLAFIGVGLLFGLRKGVRAKLSSQDIKRIAAQVRKSQAGLGEHRRVTGLGTALLNSELFMPTSFALAKAAFSFLNSRKSDKVGADEELFVSEADPELQLLRKGHSTL